VQATVVVATDGQDRTTLRRGYLSNHDVNPSLQGMEDGQCSEGMTLLVLITAPLTGAVA
jgi:hypothetical protein